jgi:hypothetical protein
MEYSGVLDDFAPDADISAKLETIDQVRRKSNRCNTLKMMGSIAFYERLFGRAFQENSNSTEADVVAQLEYEMLGECLVIEAVTEDV